jgi:hypothetical protein
MISMGDVGAFDLAPVVPIHHLTLYLPSFSRDVSRASPRTAMDGVGVSVCFRA